MRRLPALALGIVIAFAIDGQAVPARFRSVSMPGADLKGAALENSRWEESDLSVANLSGSDLNGSTWLNVKLDDASLSAASLNDAELQGVSLQQVKAPGAPPP